MRAVEVLVAAIAAAGMVVPALAQSTLAEARRAGLVGERFDGYLGFSGPVGDSVRKQALAVNIKRRSLYSGLAVRRNVTLQVAAVAAGCELLSRLQVGESYMLSDGSWRRRGPGEPPPSPEQCPD